MYAPCPDCPTSLASRVDISFSPYAIQTTSGKSRRGRKCTLPREQREHVRRIKKQNMERRRRACISAKLTALHHLAMNLIGEEPSHCHKPDKTDILNMCCAVFENVVNILKDQPELRLRVQELNEQLRGKVSLVSDSKRKLHRGVSKYLTGEHIETDCFPVPSNENSLSEQSPCSRTQSLRSSPTHDQHPANSIQTRRNNATRLLDSRVYHSDAPHDHRLFQSLPTSENTFTQSDCPIQLPLKYRMSSNNNCARFGLQCRSPELHGSYVPSSCKTQMIRDPSDRARRVWRPYMD